MKTFYQNFWFRLGMVAIATGTAYGLGRWQGDLQAEALATGGPKARPGSVKTARVGKPAEAGKNFRSLDESRERLLDILAGKLPLGVRDKFDYLDLLKGINYRDIPDLIAAIKALPATREGNSLMSELLNYLAETDPAAALAVAGQFTDPTLRGQLEIGVMEMLAFSDPAGALTELSKLPPGNATLRAYGSVFAAWAESDAEAAALAAANLTPGAQRDNALRGLADAWARLDPAAALKWALSLPAGDEKILRDMMLNVAATNPQLTAANLDKLTDPAARNEVIVAIAGRMARDDPGSALDWLNQAVNAATDVTYDNAVKQIFSSITEYNGETASALLEKVTKMDDRGYFITQLSKSWGWQDPTAALTWVSGLPETDGEVRDDSMRVIVSNWGKSNLPAAIAFVRGAPDPLLYLADIPALAQAMAKTDPKGAWAWVNTLPEGIAKDQATTNVLADLAHADFSSAWDYAVSLPEGAPRDAVMVTLVAARVKVDPAAAVLLLNQFSSQGPPFQNASRDLTYAWVRQDPQAVSTWINTLPEGAERNGAIQQMINYEGPRDPAMSLAWANQITWPQGRVVAMQRLFNDWAKLDPEAALAALPGANIPEAQLTLIKQKIDQMRATAKAK